MELLLAPPRIVQFVADALAQIWIVPLEVIGNGILHSVLPYYIVHSKDG
jgi:hypothetical protein